MRPTRTSEPRTAGGLKGGDHSLNHPETTLTDATVGFTSRLGLASAAACCLMVSLAACGGDKSDSSEASESTGSDAGGDGADGSGEDGGTGDGGEGAGDDGGTGDGGGSTGGEHAYFTRVFDDVYREGTLATSATLDLVAGPDSFSGTVTYTETIVDQSWTTCHTTLDIVRVATDPDCESCEWGYTFFLEPSTTTRTTGCVFPNPTTSFGLGSGGYLGTLSKRPTGDGDLRNVVTLGTRNALLSYVAEHTLYAENSAGDVLVDIWDPASGQVSGTTFSADAHGPHLWQMCTVPEDLAGTTQTGVPTGGTEVNDGVDCRLGPELVDVWEAEVVAGQNLLASVDTSGDDPMMWLVDPKGCLLEAIDDSIGCSDDRPLCPAINHTAAQDGTYRVVVGPRYCLNSTMNYYFDGAVQ